MKAVKTNLGPAPIGPYSQAIISGKTLYISGQIPVDPETNQLRSSTPEEETHRVMKNLQAILREAGAGFSNVVKCTIFLTDMDDFKEINKAYGSYFTEPFPARETVEVSRLPADARVEISAIAELG